MGFTKNMFISGQNQMEKSYSLQIKHLHAKERFQAMLKNWLLQKNNDFSRC